MVVHSCFVQSLRFPDVAGRKPSQKKIHLMRISSFYNAYLNTKDFPFISCKSIGYIVSGNHTPLDQGLRGDRGSMVPSLGKILFLNTATCQYVG